MISKKNFVYATFILGNAFILASCKTETKPWYGVCGELFQPGPRITLALNPNISSFDDPLFIGDCGALGTPCAVATDLTGATTDDYSEITVLRYSDASCSTFVDSDSIYYIGNAFSTISTITGSTCTAGEWFQIIWNSGNASNSFLLATTSPNPTDPPSGTVSVCTIPDSFVDLSAGDVPITACIPC